MRNRHDTTRLVSRPSQPAVGSLSPAAATRVGAQPRDALRSRAVSTVAPRTIVRPALGIVAALLLARVWFIGHRALDLDEFEHVHAAWSVAQGLLPYRDFFEHHPPALYFLVAPLFGAAGIESDPDVAFHALAAARLVMWLFTVAIVVLVYRLGALVSNRTGGAIAAALLATSSQFLDSTLEIRPDVAAVLCVLAAVWYLSREEYCDGPPRASACAAAGAAYGLSLLFTQKALFAAPGLALALMHGDRRVERAGLFATSALLPLAAAASWFGARGALLPLWHNTVMITGRLNADGFPPLPRLASNVLQQPAIYALGVAALVVRLRTRQPSAAPRAIPYTTLSLLAGVFVIGRAYDQYYALLLPLLAVLGGALVGGLEAELAQRHLRAFAAALIIAAAELSAYNYSRTFRPIGPQIDAMSWVMQHTAPRDAYLGGSPDAALFRPHAWFYFFLTGAFAADSDYRALESALESGAMRPQLVVMDRYFRQRAPAELLAYVNAHFRRANGELYLRQSENGRSTLNTSDASERFDRPFTR